MRRTGFIVVLASLALPYLLEARQAAAPTADPSDWVNLHQADDANYAKWARLPVADIRQLRRAAGINDDTPSVRVQRVDPRTLPKHLILLVSASGTRPCLKVGVYQRHGTGFRERWSTQALPDGAGFCQEPNCLAPEILAGTNGKIAVRVPFRKPDENTETCDNVRVLTYRPKGSSYRLTRDETTRAHCGFETYWAALGAVYARAVKGERIAILRAFGRDECAIAIERTSDGITISAIAPSENLEKQMDLRAASSVMTPSQCIAMGKTAELVRKTFPIPQNVAQQLVDDLSKIDLTRHECIRNRQGQCQYVLDAPSYFLQLQSGAVGQVTDLSRLRGLSSENPPLSEWIAHLLAEVDRAR